MAATDAIKLGILGAVYRNTGTYGSPTWTEIKRVRDVTGGQPWDMVDTSTRESRAKTSAKTQIDVSYQLVVRASTADAGYLALHNAAMSPDSTLDLMILNDKITVEGATGWRSTWAVSKSNEGQAIGDAIYDTFEVKPSWNSSVTGPQVVVMGATSTPSFTVI